MFTAAAVIVVAMAYNVYIITDRIAGVSTNSVTTTLITIDITALIANVHSGKFAVIKCITINDITNINIGGRATNAIAIIKEKIGIILAARVLIRIEKIGTIYPT